jgi:tetratricopeptide (TPR) repeat protein
MDMPWIAGWRACIACAVLFTSISSHATQPTEASTQAETDREQAAHHDQRGVALAQSGDLTAAIQQFQSALRLDPSFAEARYHLALAYKRGGRTDDAISAYEEVLRLHPDIVEARYMLAECCAKRGDFEGELRLLAEVVARKPEFGEARYNYGLALTKGNRGAEALEQLRAAAKLNPANPKIAMALGVALADRDARQAVEVLRGAVRLEAANAETHYNLALVLAANGGDDEAKQEFSAALSLKPNHLSARRGLAVTLMHQGKLELAAGELRRALEIAPEDAEAANNLGMVELRRKDTAAAIEALEQAVRWNPQLIKAHFNLAQAYQRASRVADARRESGRGAELTAEQRNRGRAMVLVEAAEQARKAGELATSIARLREAVAADPAFPAAHLRLGSALRESGGDADQTLAELRRVLQLDPECAEAHYQIGLTLERARREAAALDEFRIAVDMAPCRVEFMQALGRAALQAGQWAEAAAQFRGVLSWRPHDDDSRMAFERAVAQRDRVR